MSMTAKYMGPSVHERILTKEDFVEAEIAEANQFPEGFKRLFWASGEGRRSVSVEGLPDTVIEFLRDDPSFELKQDGEVVSQADPDAAHVRPDGSSPGVQGNEELAEAIGWDEAQDEPAATDTDTASGQVDGTSASEQSFASAQDSAGTSMTVGGSTPGDS